MPVTRLSAAVVVAVLALWGCAAGDRDTNSFQWDRLDASRLTQPRPPAPPVSPPEVVR